MFWLGKVISSLVCKYKADIGPLSLVAERPSGSFDKNPVELVFVGLSGTSETTYLAIREQRQILDAVNFFLASFLGELIKFCDRQRETKYQQSSITAWQKVNKVFVLGFLGPSVEKDANSENKVVSVLDDQVGCGEVNPSIGKSGKLSDPTSPVYRVPAGIWIWLRMKLIR